jgi:hypothetical protein
METETKLKLKCPRLDNKDEYIDGEDHFKHTTT